MIPLRQGLFEEQLSRAHNPYPWAQEITNALWHSFWTANEFNFRGDYAQFHTVLTTKEQQVVVRALSLIGQIEVAVKRFWADIGKVFPHQAISDMGLVIGNNEVVHSQAYTKLLEVLQLLEEFDAMLEVPLVKARIAHLRKHLETRYLDERKQVVYGLVLFTLIIEGAALFGQFYTILHLNRFRNVLKDAAQQVQYTRLEEQLHAKAGVLLINTLRAEYPELFDQEMIDRVRQNCIEAVEHEARLIDWMLDGYEGDHLSAPILKAYVSKRLGDLMEEIGIEPVGYDITLTGHHLWMEEELKGATLTDFFQQRPVEYQKNHRTYNEDELF